MRWPLAYTVTALCESLANGASFEYCFFWGGPRSELVQPQDFGWFSQWAKTPFIVDDVEYYTAEHYMMAQKPSCSVTMKPSTPSSANPDPTRSRLLVAWLRDLIKQPGTPTVTRLY
jgi:predicted NAD-dependent protein-ADP-ribosyltransferase YbiA (DUF1768 family)